ncbi:MAG: hydrogenase maturation protease [Sedimenticola sp.]|nr:hydrogenase maturation protease [Sedimenticola sp.]
MRHLICFGNELHGDDGFGPAVFRRLAVMDIPKEWRLFDAGNRGLDTLALFEACEEVILVDAAAPAGHPGRLSQPLPEVIKEESALPGHGAGVGYLLKALNSLNGQPPLLRIITAEMSSLTPFQPELSAPVAEAIDETVALLCDWMAEGKDG